MPPSSVVLLAISLFFALRTYALPVNSTTTEPESGTADADDLRSMYDIVWGCLTTVFACSWLTVHPNVPTDDIRRKGSLHITLERIKLAGIAVIAPEVILILAIRQWKMARKVKHRYPSLTITHGFVFSMAGFVDDSGNVIEHVSHLRPDSLPSQDELQDRSKSDALAKLIIVLQTLWFVVGCILRHIRQMPVTQLEILALGFASCNAVIYAVWLYKPMDVTLPFILPYRHWDDCTSLRFQEAVYAPSIDVASDTGYAPSINVASDTGYAPSINVASDTGYVPSIDVASDTGYAPSIGAACDMVSDQEILSGVSYLPELMLDPERVSSSSTICPLGNVCSGGPSDQGEVDFDSNLCTSGASQDITDCYSELEVEEAGSVINSCNLSPYSGISLRPTDARLVACQETQSLSTLVPKIPYYLIALARRAKRKCHWRLLFSWTRSMLSRMKALFSFQPIIDAGTFSARLSAYIMENAVSRPMIHVCTGLSLYMD